MEHQVQTGVDLHSADETSSSASSLFHGGTLPTAWLGDDTDDGSLSSLETGEKTSSINDVKIAFEGRSDGPADANVQDLEHSQELDPSLSFQPGKAYEVRGSPGFVLHHIGECIPCLYHTRKADGCRKGDDCDHCHLCNVSEAKRRRNRNQLEAHKAHRRAARREATRESKASDS
ncbi:unnamed protein product [Symbiodinium sp. CCMP2592]|nr:unnamed protein product [Symbiodinium sp. CCMP2592]